MNAPKDEDQDWYKVLSGETEKPVGTLAATEGRALRNVIVAEEDRAAARPAPEPNLEGLLERLEQEGLLEPKVRRSRHQGWYALAASVALAAFMAPVIIQMVTEQPGPTIEIPRGLVEPQIIKVSDPEISSLQLSESLDGKDATVERYLYDGSWIVDIQVTMPMSPAVAAALSQYEVSAPAHGRVILAFPED